MKPLQGKTLTPFQEEMKHIRYILIDEMSFIGPNLLLKIDSRLREAFSRTHHLYFGGVSIILIGDLAQLPPVMDKIIYVSHSNAKLLWEQFTTVVTLQTMFLQQGDDPTQTHFCETLKNLCNAKQTHQDWEMLMTRTNKLLTTIEKQEFDNSIHLFASNDLVRLHNKRMLKQLNLPIAISIAINTNNKSNIDAQDD